MTQQISDAKKNKVTAYADFVIRFRWLAIIAALLITAVAMMGLKNLGFASDYRVFFGDNNPQLQAFEKMQKVYSKDDNILFVIKPAEGDVFTPKLLREIQNLTQKSWKTPFSTRVDSITNFQHTYASEDDLVVRDLVVKSNPLLPVDIEEIRNITLNEPLLYKRLISPDGTATAVNITVNLPQKDLTEIPIVMGFARDLAAEFQQRNPEARVAMTGMVPMNSSFFEASMRDMSTLTPIMYGVLLVVTFFMVRSVSGTFATLIMISLSAMAAMGVAGWLGIKLSPPSAVAPTVILTIAIADSIHILITMFASMRAGMTKHDAIVESMRVNFSPVFLTSLTTAVGFLSLNFSDSPPFKDLGNITAAGVIAAWIFSVLLLPALMSTLPLRVKAVETKKTNLMAKLADLVINKRKILLATSAIVVLGLGFMVPKNILNDQFVQYFDESIQFRSDSDFISENLSGMYQLQWSLPANEPGGINDPAYLKTVDEFANWLRTQPGVDNVLSISDVFRRLNKNMHGDRPDMYSLPSERDLAAQFLLLYEMSLPYGLDLNNQINIDKSAVRLVATTQNFTTNELKDLDRKSTAWLKGKLGNSDIESTGPVMMFAHITTRNINSMLVGTTAALVIISLILIVALRSFKLGVISLVPNLVPVIMTFGIWAIFVGQIDVAASIVTATSLGVVVDATVHFLSKYQRAQREKKFNTEDAVRYAFSNVGIALFATSLILIAGFAVLTFSTFRLNASMGQLTAVAIAAALLADFILLPALLLTVDRKRKTVPSPQPTSVQAAE